MTKDRSRKWKVIGTVGGIILSLFVVFLLMFLKEPTGEVMRFTGTAPTLDSYNASPGLEGSFEKEIKEKMKMGESIFEKDRKVVRWIFEPGDFPIEDINIVWPMSDIEEKAMELKEKGQSGVIYVGISTSLNKEIVDIIPLKFDFTKVKAGEEDIKVEEEKKYNEQDKETILATEIPGEIPEKKDYDFLGWYIQNESGTFVEFDFKTPIEDNTVIHGIWSKAQETYPKGYTSYKKSGERLSKYEGSNVKFMGTNTFNRGKVIVAPSPWETVEWMAYSISPIMIILIGLVLIKDIATIRWYRKLKKMKLEEEK